MSSLSKCSSNGSLTSSTSTVTFDTTTGMATFSNLAISQKGMYMLLINVHTVSSNDYNFECISAPILVKSSSDSILNLEPLSEPDMYLTFTGNYSNQSPDTLKKFEAMIYNCFISSYGILIQLSITLYQGSIKAVIGTSGDSSSYANLVSSLNGSNFSLSSDVILTDATINGAFYNFTNLASDSSSGSSSSIDTKNAVIFRNLGAYEIWFYNFNYFNV